MAACARRMSYGEAVAFLSSLQVFGAKFGLETARRLATLARNPQDQLRFIHVAGTNGKGSTCAMLESIYRAAGSRVGLYTSPHLVSFRERIQMNRDPIPEGDVVRLVAEARDWLKEFSEENHPTFFELVTILAARYFAEQKCDLVIWETGLGGRLDATNIVTPLASVITNVQFDHEKWLGNTIEEIAREKAGIIKPRVAVVTGASGAALDIIRETAARSCAPLHIVNTPDFDHALGLAGAHQRMNAAVAIKTVDVLSGAFSVSDATIATALSNVQWPGRFQIIQRGNQTLILDGAHNPAGAEALAETLRAASKGKPITFVVGILEDKNWQSVCHTLGALATKVIVTNVTSSRSAAPEIIAAAIRDANSSTTVLTSNSLIEALPLTQHDPFVVITGSLYLVGEAMELLGLSPVIHERALNEWFPPQR
jgi:dihydrofolate synthase / folylpolyglutamate synthase